jgi:hypothetical protein
MSDRHVPRLCHSCTAPMASQEDSCWHCGVQWASEDVPSTTLRAIAGGLLAHPVTELARAEMRHDNDRWTRAAAPVAARR